MSANLTDDELIQQALDLASAGIGLASPNPYVGAVIADAHGEVVGKGTFTYDGVKHAEILALEAAGARARGGTLYINLEPHAHQGRTPPCTDALIAAGIRRVIASMVDPNPKVSGKGFEQLRAAGVEVEVGNLEQPARRLNEAFARYIRHGVPLVTLKSAMTLDGKIALTAGTGKTRANAEEFSGTWITGELARTHAHELRHQQDAILVGVGTILADNPLLTDRSARPRRRPLLRVILDSQLRLHLDARLVKSAAAERKNDVLVFCVSGDSEKKKQLEELGVRVEQVPADEAGRVDLRAVLQRLGALQFLSLLIEGGSTVNGATLAAGITDKVFLYYAPQILGGAKSVPFATTTGEFKPVHIHHPRLHYFGSDFAVEGYLRDPYAE